MHGGEHDDDKRTPGAVHAVVLHVPFHGQFQRRGRESVLRDGDAERAGGFQVRAGGGGGAERREVQSWVH